MTAAREPAKGDQVSYRGRLYKVHTVWGGQNAGMGIVIMPTGPDPHEPSHTTKRELLVWSDTRRPAGARQPGCWIVMKPRSL